MKYLNSLLLLWASSGWAATNSITINNASGSAITANPVTTSRVFVQGEIPNYPRPSINGSPLAQWQANVMTRWRDGSGACTVTAATNATPIVVTCSAAHGFLDGEVVTLTGVGGNTAANGTWTVWATLANKITLMNSAGNGAYTSGGAATGPAYGSVKHALVTYAISIVAAGNRSVLFLDDPNPCHLGNQAACDEAALSQAGMLAFDAGGGAGSWGAATRVTSNSIAVTTDARTMLGAGAWRYWIRGPLLTQAIVEDRSTARAYDFGYKDRYSTVLAAAGGISAAATSFAVVDAAEIVALGLPAVILIDLEQMNVTAVAGNTLTVTRAFNGTTAAQHLTTRLVRILGLAGVDPNGWQKRPVAVLNTQNLNGTLSASSNTMLVTTPEILNNLVFPYNITIDNEEMTVCGTDNGNLPGTLKFGVGVCPSVNGRGVNGTTAAAHKWNAPIFARPFDSLWQAAPGATYKSIHPLFVVSFYAGWAGVRIKYGLENVWIDRLQDQFISASLLAGPSNATTLRSLSPFLFAAQERWQDEYWYGTEPGATATDFNFPYMISSGALMNYDVSRSPDASTINLELANIAANGGTAGVHYGPAQTGRFTTDMPTAGGRPDIGPLTSWNMLYLYEMGNANVNATLFTNLMSEVNVYGNAPVHFREALTGQPFDLWNSADAFGRWISPNARNSRVFFEDNDSPFVVPVGLAADYSRVGAAARHMTNWNVDISHQTPPPFVHYLVTGDWWVLEELMAWGSYDLMFTTSGTSQGSRHNDWGAVTSSDYETRGIGWAIRSIAMAGFFAPNSLVEHKWFNEKLANNAAIREGVINLVGGRFYEPYSTGKWFWGRNTQASGGSNPLRWIGIGATSAPIYGSINGGGCTGTANLNDFIEDPWMDNFNYVAWGWANDMGFTFYRSLLNEAIKHNIQIVLDPLFTPKHHLAAECLAVNAAAISSAPLTAWNQVIAEQGADSYTGDLARWTAGCAQDPNLPYACIFLAATSFAPGVTDGAFTGDDAWSWMLANTNNQSAMNNSPKWAILPRQAVAPPVSRSRTSGGRVGANGMVLMR